MKIAAVTMTYNDGYKIKEWKQHYLEYKDLLDVFVIVDNCSNPSYVEELKTNFPEATIISRCKNGGCTAAYNNGIQYVLDNTDAEAIAILGNDIKLTKNCLGKLYNYLFSDDSLGMVSTAILNINSNIIDNYGHIVKGFLVKNDCKGQKIEDIKELYKYTDLVSGGFNMAKKEFYEKTGLQDEKLFMYCDELDTMFKACKAGYKFGVIASEYAWHWHINPPNASGMRRSETRYMIARNKVYISKKHQGAVQTVLCFGYVSIVMPAIQLFNYILKHEKAYLRNAKYTFLGGIYGLRGDMNRNKYSLPVEEEE